MSLVFLTALAAAAGVQQPVEIRFDGTVGDKAFQCGTTYPGVGKPAASIKPTDFRFYVTGVALIDAKGRHVPVTLDQDGLWQYRDVALIDFEDGSGPCRGGNAGINRAIKGTAPAGQYRGVAFEVGLPPDLNHGDAATAPAPLNFTGMFWAWAVGYRMFKVDLEGSFPMRRPGFQTGFSIHIGSTECGKGPITSAPAQPCGRPNRIAVSFDRFDPAKNVVAVDLAAMLADTDVGHNTPDTAPGCMSGQDDPECKGVFAAFGLPFGSDPVRPQRVFRKR